MKLISVTELSTLGKGAIGLILTLGALLNVPAVSAIAAQHPHLMAVGGTITALASLLANPQVQKILGVTETSVVDTPAGQLKSTTTTEVTTGN